MNLQQPHRIAFALTICTCIVILFTFVAARPQSAQPAAETATSQVLINEIKELRRALQDYAVVTQRTQLMSERLRFQQTRVDKLSDDRENVLMQLEASAAEAQQIDESTKSLEKLMGNESDASLRITIERDYKSALIRTEDHKRREQRLREREVQLNQLIQTEQAALTELKEKMQAVEQSLETRTTRRP